MEGIIRFNLIIFYSLLCLLFGESRLTDKVESSEDYTILTTKYIDKHTLTPNTCYLIQSKINLRGKTIVIPEDCELRFTKGFFYNGSVYLKNTLLDGDVSFQGRVFGSVQNDTIKVEWFRCEDHLLADVFNLSENKTIVFKPSCRFILDYSFCVPSCTVLGNNSTIEVRNTSESSRSIGVAKLRNKHYDGGGYDTFTIESLSFVTSSDSIYLFSLQNTGNCRLINCSFTCLGKGRNCSHAVDLRGYNSHMTFEKCRFVNQSSARGGGCLWIRSFGPIDGVMVNECEFFNNCTDEVFALNAVISDIKNIVVKNSHFYYERGLFCLEPHVFWGMTKMKGKIKDVCFESCTLKSDFIPAFILNLNGAEGVIVEKCAFVFDRAKFNHGAITTTAFNGKMTFNNNTIIIQNSSRYSNSSITLFNSDVKVYGSTIINDCPSVYLGGAAIANSIINYNNSQLYNGYISKSLKSCKIFLGSNTPTLAANPYNQKEPCDWEDNVIESEVPVDFHFVYDSDYLVYKNNRTKNISIKGNPFKMK